MVTPPVATADAAATARIEELAYAPGLIPSRRYRSLAVTSRLNPSKLTLSGVDPELKQLKDPADPRGYLREGSKLYLFQVRGQGQGRLGNTLYRLGRPAWSHFAQE